MGGHRASDGSEGDLVDGPVDLAAVRADDALIDALAGGAGAAGDPDGYRYGFGFDSGDGDRLVAILAAWRADIEADPMPELVSLDEAAHAVAAGHESRDRRLSRGRRRMPFAIAAVAAAIACAGLTVAVHGAMPGDTLWGVSKVFFSERAASVERVEEVRSRIDAANGALARGDVGAARHELAQVNITITKVEPEQQAPLVAERDRVQSSLENNRWPDTREPSARSSERSAAPPSSRGGQTAEEPVTPSRAAPAAPAAPGAPSPEDSSPSAVTPPPAPVPPKAPESGTTTNGMSSSPSATTPTG